MRPQRELTQAVDLLEYGYSATETARLIGIPRSTVRDWRNGRIPGRRAPDVGCITHGLATLERSAYAYLLGMYLGDGCISIYGRQCRLRITLDALYEGIVAECAAAIDAVAPGRPAYVFRSRRQRTAEVSKYWKHWPCFFPQHGPGPKHLRTIRLESWQQRIVDDFPQPFLRGLIHSDGCRNIATERKGTYVRRAARYSFKNASEDILQLFMATCDLVGVRYTRPSKRQIAIYRKDSVARLDAFIGPKS